MNKFKKWIAIAVIVYAALVATSVSAGNPLNYWAYNSSTGKISPIPVTAQLQVPGTPGGAGCLQIDGSGNIASTSSGCGGGGGSGTVTSVAFTAPSGFGVSGSPITTSGTIGLTISNATTVLNSLLPTQTSNSGKFLTTDGTNSSWATVSGTGTVTSVSGSGGTTGLTLTGGPITTSGTLTLGGTLAIANGGTGQTTAANAINALLPAQGSFTNQFLSTSGATARWQNFFAVGSSSNVINFGSTRNILETDGNGNLGMLGGIGSSIVSSFAFDNSGYPTIGSNTAAILSIAGVQYTFPTSNSSGVLTNDGSGNLTWASGGGGTPAGSNEDVQFNNFGSFGADTGNFEYNNSTQTLSVGGNTITDGSITFGGGGLDDLSYDTSSYAGAPNSVAYSVEAKNPNLSFTETDNAQFDPPGDTVTCSSGGSGTLVSGGDSGGGTMVLSNVSGTCANGDTITGSDFGGSGTITSVPVSVDTFNWSDNQSHSAAGVAMTGFPQTLSYGITITFASTTGHTPTNNWGWTVTSSNIGNILAGNSMTIGGTDITAPSNAVIPWTLPNAQGASNTFLENDGSGNLSWTTTPAFSAPLNKIVVGSGGGTTNDTLFTYDPTNLSFNVGFSDVGASFFNIDLSSGFGKWGDINNVFGNNVLLTQDWINTSSLSDPAFTFSSPFIQIGSASYNFPSSNGAGALTNDGSGNLSWTSISESSQYDYIISQVGGTTTAITTATGAVLSSNTDATTVFQAVLDAAVSSAGENVLLQNGTYVIDATLLIKANNTFWTGMGLNTIIEADGASVSPFFKYNSTDIESTGLNYFTLKNTNATPSGVGLLVNDAAFVNSRSLFFSDFAIGLQFIDSVNKTFYNSFYDPIFQNVGTCIDMAPSGNPTNHNSFYNVRCITNASGTGLSIAGGSSANDFYSFDAEPASTSGTTGVNISGNSFSNTFYGPDIEGNNIGFKTSSGDFANAVIGGVITTNTTDVDDAANDSVFEAVSDTTGLYNDSEITAPNPLSGVQYFTPTTGGTVTLNAAPQVILNPSGSLLALTIALYGNPFDGAKIDISTTHTITTVTFTGGTVVGNPAGLAVGGNTYTYSASAGEWILTN